MSSKLRRLLTAVLRPPRAFAAWLRPRPGIAVTLMLVTLLVFTATLAAIVGGSTSGRTPAPVETFSYSDLRTAIQDKTVKTATLKPAELKAEIVLKNGKEHTVGYTPTDETLAERLAASGAQVEVDTSFARRGFPWSAIILLFGLFAVVGLIIYMSRQQAKAANGMHDQHTKKAAEAGRAARRALQRRRRLRRGRARGRGAGRVPQGARGVPPRSAPRCRPA